MVMGIAFGTAVTVFRNTTIAEYKGTYNYIKMLDIINDVPYEFPIMKNRFAQVSTENFSKIPGSPVAYWAGNAIFENFQKGRYISDYSIPASGTSTGDNDRFLRLWYEIVHKNICFHAVNGEKSSGRWFPCNKGGAYRKWSGGGEYVIDWEDDGKRIKTCPKAFLRNVSSIFLPGLTWSKLGSGAFSIRKFPNGYICDSIGCCLFCKNYDLDAVLALLNTKVGSKMLSIINPSMGRQPGYIGAVPVNEQIFETSDIFERVQQNVSLSTIDWDSYETSWDFVKNPLVRLKDSMKFTVTDGDSKTESYILQGAYRAWKNDYEQRFNQLKANEEELNRIFIDIYGLQDELTPEVEDKDVTVYRIFDTKDEIPESMGNSKYAITKQDVVKNFISYAVGCMFGRYSLDVEGLAYAGGDWDASKYQTFAADADNIIPICDDEYFEDDIVGRFVAFVKTVYGAETLEDNLRFIADALGGRGQPRDIIRRYFLNDFFKDHCQTYQKRPIYWLFDSGKKNGFKALIYMHRYQPDTIARVRTDYVHEQQSRYRTAIADVEQRMTDATTGERVNLGKTLARLQEQDTELRGYEEKIHHLADQMISIDLDDGVKHNYGLFQDILAKIK